jgi:DNA-binding GntR family transcriptional regulator
MTGGLRPAQTPADTRRAALLSSLRGDADTGSAPDAPAESLALRIFEDLAIEIVEGRLPPWQDLNSVELGRRFKTSRTPVREALLALQREGLVVIPPRRRPYVSPHDGQLIRDIYEIRAQLSQLVSRLVIERASDADLRRLWDCHDRLEDDARHDRVDDYFWHNVEFRNVELSLTGNPELVRIMRSLGLRTLRFRHLSLSQPGRVGRSAADHRRLMHAYDDRDLATACALTQALVLSGLRAIETSGAADQSVEAVS